MDFFEFQTSLVYRASSIQPVLWRDPVCPPPPLGPLAKSNASSFCHKFLPHRGCTRAVKGIFRVAEFFRLTNQWIGVANRVCRAWLWRHSLESWRPVLRPVFEFKAEATQVLSFSTKCLSADSGSDLLSPGACLLGDFFYASRRDKMLGRGASLPVSCCFLDGAMYTVWTKFALGGM